MLSSGLPLGIIETSLISGGVTLPGIGIFVQPNDKPLVTHELGHYFQFVNSGFNLAGFYLNVGIPSIINQTENIIARSLGLNPKALGIDHTSFYTETDANRLAFGDKGLGVRFSTTTQPSLPWYNRLNLYFNILKH